MGLFGRTKHTHEDEAEQQPPRLPQPVPPESVSFETVLGHGSVMKGDLYSPGSVRLEGTFEGDLQIDGNALVGENARIIADLTAANNVTIAGAVRGNVSGQRVQLLRTGRVWGDIEASSISTEEGAFIQGTITMKGGEIPPEFEEMMPLEPSELAGLATATAQSYAPVAAESADAAEGEVVAEGANGESVWEDVEEADAAEPGPDNGYGAAESSAADSGVDFDDTEAYGVEDDNT